jgi:transcription elongation factor Elf1
MRVIKKFTCKVCGPQKLIGDFGSKTHVLCLSCGEEISLKELGPIEEE